MTQKVKPSTLADTSVTAGTYGGPSQQAVFTVDAQGRLTYAGNATPTVANTNISGVITPSQLASSATYNINVTGSAGSVANGVYTNGSYSDPSWLTLSKSKVGLGNVDNTADANKNVNSANTAAFSTTQSGTDNSTKIATTEFVQSRITAATVGWNVTYTGNFSVGNGGVYTLPANCIGVYVWAQVWGGNNNGGTFYAQVRNGAGSTLGTLSVHGTNDGPAKGDGGSGMYMSGATFLPMSADARSIYCYTGNNNVGGTLYVQAHVTKS